MLPKEKLEALVRRYGELEHLLCSQEVLTDRNRLQKLNKERSDMEAVRGSCRVRAEDRIFLSHSGSTGRLRER